VPPSSTGRSSCHPLPICFVKDRLLRKDAKWAIFAGIRALVLPILYLCLLPAATGAAVAAKNWVFYKKIGSYGSQLLYLLGFSAPAGAGVSGCRVYVYRLLPTFGWSIGSLAAAWRGGFRSWLLSSVPPLGAPAAFLGRVRPIGVSAWWFFACARRGSKRAAPGCCAAAAALSVRESRPPSGLWFPPPRPRRRGRAFGFAADRSGAVRGSGPLRIRAASAPALRRASGGRRRIAVLRVAPRAFARPFGPLRACVALGGASARGCPPHRSPALPPPCGPPPRLRCLRPPAPRPRPRPAPRPAALDVVAVVPAPGAVAAAVVRFPLAGPGCCACRRPLPVRRSRPGGGLAAFGQNRILPKRRLCCRGCFAPAGAIAHFFRGDTPPVKKSARKRWRLPVACLAFLVPRAVPFSEIPGDRTQRGNGNFGKSAIPLPLRASRPLFMGLRG